jgi:hypothetical protein
MGALRQLRPTSRGQCFQGRQLGRLDLPHPRTHPLQCFVARKFMRCWWARIPMFCVMLEFWGLLLVVFGSFCFNFWFCIVFAWSKHFCMSFATRDWPCCNIKICRCVIGICYPGLQQARAATMCLHPTTQCWCLRRPPTMLLRKKSKKVEDVGGARIPM